MTLTAGLAIWGAILSTLLAVLKLVEFFRDRVNIKVTVRGNYKVYPKDPLYGDASYVLITAVNKGRRPVTITHASLLGSGSQEYLLDKDSLTHVELTEGKSHIYHINENDVKSKSGLHPDKYVACVIDATGRCFWSHNFLIRFLKLHRNK
jgi:hypothetical protein